MKVTRQNKEKIEIPFLMEEFEFDEINGEVTIQVFAKDYSVEIETNVLEILEDLGCNVLEKKIHGLEDEYNTQVFIDNDLLDDEMEVLESEDIKDWLIKENIIKNK